MPVKFHWASSLFAMRISEVMVEIKEVCTALPLLIFPRYHTLLGPTHTHTYWNEHRQCTNHPGLGKKTNLTIRSKGMFKWKERMCIASSDTTHCLITPPPSTLKPTTANVPPVRPLGLPFLCVSNQNGKRTMKIWGTIHILLRLSRNSAQIGLKYKVVTCPYVRQSYVRRPTTLSVSTRAPLSPKKPKKLKNS